MSASSIAFPLQLAEAEQQLKTAQQRLGQQKERVASLATRVVAHDVSLDRTDLDALQSRPRVANMQFDSAHAESVLLAIGRDVAAYESHIDLLRKASVMTDAEWEALAKEAAEVAVESERALRQLPWGMKAKGPLKRDEELAIREDVEKNFRARKLAQLSEEEAKLREETRALADRNKATLHKLLPPKVFAKVTSAEIESTPASKACASWYGSKKERVFMLRGGIGIGKSVAAGLVAKAAVFEGLDVSWHSARELVSAVLHQYDEKSPKLGDHLVVVDDVGREPKPEDFGEALCTFLDDYEAKVLLTTNMKKDDFRARYDARLVDRLREVGAAVDIAGETRRRKSDLF